MHAVDLERGDEYSASSELHARYGKRPRRRQTRKSIYIGSSWTRAPLDLHWRVEGRPSASWK